MSCFLQENPYVEEGGFSVIAFFIFTVSLPNMYVLSYYVYYTVYIYSINRELKKRVNNSRFVSTLYVTRIRTAAVHALCL